MTMKLDIYGLATTERMYAYSQSMQIMGQCGCIGYLRGDFGHGEEFYTTWFDHCAEHKTDEFKAEFDKVVNALRAKDGCGLFASRDSMGRFCRDHADVAFAGNSCTEYGFKLKTMEHTYLLRCNPNHGDYNFYLYAYVSRHLEHHLEQAKRGIRFITPGYKELFRIPDGDTVRICRSDGTHIDRVCRYIDDCHMEIGSGWDSLFHICQFAEQMERCSNTVIPLRSSLPEKCYSVLPSGDEIITICRGEDGYFHTDKFGHDRQAAQAIVDEYNERNGVTKAQEAAMLAGSMFGWATPAADPRNYNDKGEPIKPKARERGEAR